MLFWIILFIGAAGGLKIWSAHSDAKFERERKLAKIQRKLEKIEEEKNRE